MLLFGDLDPIGSSRRRHARRSNGACNRCVSKVSRCDVFGSFLSLSGAMGLTSPAAAALNVCNQRAHHKRLIYATSPLRTAPIAISYPAVGTDLVQILAVQPIFFAAQQMRSRSEPVWGRSPLIRATVAAANWRYRPCPGSWSQNLRRHDARATGSRVRLRHD